MDSKKIIIILSIIIILLLSTVIYFLANDNDNDNEKKSNQDNNISDDISNDYDTSDNVVCLPKNIKFYIGNDTKREEIKPEIIGEEKRYWQVGEFTPTQKIYNFDNINIDESNSWNLYATNMGILNNLNIGDEQDEIDANHFLDLFEKIEIDKKDELLKCMVVFEEIFYFIDLHENDYKEYMTEKLYKIIINSDDRLEGAYGDNHPFSIKTLDEFQNDALKVMGKENIYSCIAVDAEHTIIRKNIRYESNQKDDKVFFKKIDGKWTVVETTMLKVTKGATWGADGIITNYNDDITEDLYE